MRVTPSAMRRVSTVLWNCALLSAPEMVPMKKRRPSKGLNGEEEEPLLIPAVVF